MRFVGQKFRRIRYGTKLFWFNLIRKNPYPEGSAGSLTWKVSRGKPLDEEEQRAAGTMGEALGQLMASLRASPNAAFQMEYLRFAVNLLDGLPRNLRDNINNSSVRDAKEKIELLLPLASYCRERKTLRVASYAFFISALATLISVGTMVVAFWTLFTSSG